MRPPIRAISIASVAMASRVPMPPTTASLGTIPAISACCRALAATRSARAAATGRFRQFFPATISLSTRITTVSRKAMSIAAAAAPSRPTVETAMRPAAHSSARQSRGMPLTGNRPVQLGTAVRIKPVTVAAAKPNSISWRCQASTSIGPESGTMPSISRIDSGSPKAAQRPANRKNGRKPRVRKGTVSAWRFRRAETVSVLSVIYTTCCAVCAKSITAPKPAIGDGLNSGVRFGR